MIEKWKEKLSVNGTLSYSMFLEFMEEYTFQIPIWTTTGHDNWFIMELIYDNVIFYAKVRPKEKRTTNGMTYLKEGTVRIEGLGSVPIGTPDYNRLIQIIEDGTGESIDVISDGKIYYI